MSNKTMINKYRVFEKLDDMKMSKAELANSLGVSEQAVIKRWVNGWKKDATLLLCSILECALSEIEK